MPRAPPVLPPWPTGEGEDPAIEELLQHIASRPRATYVFKREHVARCSFVPGVFCRFKVPRVIFLFSVARPPGRVYGLDQDLGIAPMPWHLRHLAGPVFEDSDQLERDFKEGTVALLQVGAMAGRSRCRGAGGRSPQRATRPDHPPATPPRSPAPSAPTTRSCWRS
jgi:hypothetical protein